MLNIIEPLLFNVFKWLRVFVERVDVKIINSCPGLINNY